MRGINVKGSMKCMEMLKKIHFVQERNNGRGAVLATGTCLCNSISDAYAMQMFVQYDELEKRQLHIFDNWVRAFAKIEQLCEIDVSASKFRLVRRFSQFHNLPELSLLFFSEYRFPRCRNKRRFARILRLYRHSNTQK